MLLMILYAKCKVVLKSGCFFSRVSWCCRGLRICSFAMKYFLACVLICQQFPMRFFLTNFGEIKNLGGYKNFLSKLK